MHCVRDDANVSMDSDQIAKLGRANMGKLVSQWDLLPNSNIFVKETWYQSHFEEDVGLFGEYFVELLDSTRVSVLAYPLSPIMEAYGLDWEKPPLWLLDKKGKPASALHRCDWDQMFSEPIGFLFFSFLFFGHAHIICEQNDVWTELCTCIFKWFVYDQPFLCNIYHIIFHMHIWPFLKHQSFVPVPFENPSVEGAANPIDCSQRQCAALTFARRYEGEIRWWFWKVFPGKNPPKGMGSFKRWKGENGWNKIELQWSTEEFAIFLLHSIHMFEVRAQQHWWATVLFFFQMWFSCQVGVQIHIYTLITSLVDWDRCDFCPQKHRLASRLKPVSYYVWQIPHDQHCRIVNYLHHCLLQT